MFTHFAFNVCVVVLYYMHVIIGFMCILFNMRFIIFYVGMCAIYVTYICIAVMRVM